MPKVGSVIMRICAAAVIGWCLHTIVPAYTEYLRAKEEVSEVEASLLKARESREQLAGDIALLHADPNTVERIAREKFNWRRSGEEVYEFEN